MWRDPKFLLLLAASSLIVMAGAVLTPILPEVIQQLRLDQGVAGSLVSVHFLTFALCIPFLGVLADRIGKHRVLVVSLVLYSWLGMAGAILPTFNALLVDRCLLGIACAGIIASGLGLMTSLYEAEQRTQAIAYASGTMTLANIIYPLLAGSIGSLHWQFAFGLYGLGLPLAALAFVLFESRDSKGWGPSLVAQTVPTSMSATAIAGPVTPNIILRQPIVLRLLVSLTIVMGVVYGVGIYLPLYLQTQLATEPGLNGLLLSLMAVGAALSAVFGLPWLTKRFDILGIIVSGLGMMACLLMVLPTLATFFWILVATMMFGMGFGLVTPGLYNALANVTPPESHSSVLSTGTGVGLLGQFLAPLVLGPVLTLVGFTGVFNTQACLTLAIGVLIVLPLQSQK